MWKKNVYWNELINFDGTHLFVVCIFNNDEHSGTVWEKWSGNQCWKQQKDIIFQLKKKLFFYAKIIYKILITNELLLL